MAHLPGMIKHRLEPLFAHPVYFTLDKYQVTQDEIEYILSTKEKNSNVSNDKKILVSLINLREWIESKVNIYCLDILKLRSVKPYITQSWINFQEKGKDLHWHNHPNSFISGAFHFQDKESPIVFKNFKNIFTLNPEVEENNVFNSDNISYATEKNSLILFPSSLWHRTETNNNQETRISLAFNTWLKGELGDENDLNKLKVE